MQRLNFTNREPSEYEQIMNLSKLLAQNSLKNKTFNEEPDSMTKAPEEKGYISQIKEAMESMVLQKPTLTRSSDVFNEFNNKENDFLGNLGNSFTKGLEYLTTSEGLPLLGEIVSGGDPYKRMAYADASNNKKSQESAMQKQYQDSLQNLNNQKFDFLKGRQELEDNRQLKDREIEANKELEDFRSKGDIELQRIKDSEEGKQQKAQRDFEAAERERDRELQKYLEGIRNSKNGIKNKTTDKEQKSNIQFKKNIDVLETYVDQLSKEKMGSILRSAKEKLGKNESMSEFKTVSDTLVAEVARKLSGESRVSDKEMAMARQIVPNSSDNQKQAKAKLKILRSLYFDNSSADSSGSNVIVRPYEPGSGKL